MKKIISLLLVITIVFLMSSTGSAEENENKSEYSFMDYYLDNVSVEPMKKIEKDGIVYEFAYVDGKRVSTSKDNWKRVFEYDSDMLVRQIDDEIIDFLILEREYKGLLLDGNAYYYVFDEMGTVVALENSSREIVCEYHYDGAFPKVIAVSKNEIDIKASELNPFRYRGWYFDVETSLYYLGQGIFYDPACQRYIQNDYKYDDLRGEPAIFQTVGNAYNTLMGMSSYGASYCAFPSQTEWNNGIRWYDGLQQVELIARCIYAENNHPNHQNDRKGVGLVIRNRVAQNFSHYGVLSPYNIVKYPSAFATVNPSGTLSSMSDNTSIARQVMNKSESAFQQATFIACMVYCSTNYSDYSMVVGIPSYMSSQHTHFLSVNYAYSYGVLSVTSSGQWKYNNTNIYDVCIPGSALLTSFSGTGSQCLQTYYLNGYNVFFRY